MHSPLRLETLRWVYFWNHWTCFTGSEDDSSSSNGEEDIQVEETRTRPRISKTSTVGVSKKQGDERRGGHDGRQHGHMSRDTVSKQSVERGKYPSSSSTPAHCPPGCIWVPVPQKNSGSEMFNMLGSMSVPPFPGNWQYVGPPNVPSIPERDGVDIDARETPTVEKATPIKKESIQKRLRREKKREADEIARRRESAGLRPYVVRVRVTGIVDSGCEGHLKWQEYIRDLTPRFLDMSVFKYEDQNENSKAKLRDALRKKFEFVDHEVTDASLDKMIKTWMRKDRERMKRFHGSKEKAPERYTNMEWETMRKYWDSDSSKQESERMSKHRGKVAHNPRVGRLRYGGKSAKVVSVYTSAVKRFLFECVHCGY